ncbi:ETS-related transcription factor Elf-4-like [Paramuricea clavata]|uniref:ETS-related transcription factor Elf-4-like n=2 Tax=Paramuricea clavata TaxID=317549 RepID=A0A6S7FYA8_PARCT|nr:ETS-related transcription factor Elf-4-like [Paramuricea clavata]
MNNIALYYMNFKMLASHTFKPRAQYKQANHAGPILAARTSIYLWEFLLEILEDPECASIVRWTDKAKGEFEFLNISEVARQWGIVKRRPNMDKIKMCRAMRYYYKKDIIQKVKGRHFVYKFLQLPYNHPVLPSPSPPPQEFAERRSVICYTSSWSGE